MLGIRNIMCVICTKPIGLYILEVNMDKNNSHVLYANDSVVPIFCEREDWRSCPEHRGLSEKRPDVKKSHVGVDDSVMVDDPDDDIVSVNEYAGSPKVSREQFSDDFWDYLTGTKGSSKLREGLASANKAGERVLRGGLIASIGTAATGVGLALGGVIGGAVLLPMAAVVFALLPLAFVAKRIVKKAVFKSKANQVKESFKQAIEKDGVLPDAKDGENMEYFMHLNKTLSKEDAGYYNADTFYRQNA